MESKRQHLACVTVMVRDYEEAKAYYCGMLGSKLIEDTPLPDGNRWMLVAPPGSHETCLLLARAATPEQVKRVGDQTGGRVFLFLHTDDFWRDFRALQEKGVNFCEQPRRESSGVVAVFEDLYGNRWDLLQLARGT
jgi:catechol 2,3-dioxygenase-like lactoylglutathione lyase family enzyme